MGYTLPAPFKQVVTFADDISSNRVPGGSRSMS